jgi:hypothetical protein
MSKYYVFGFSPNEAGLGKATDPNILFEDIMKNPAFIAQEKGNVLIYFMDIILSKKYPEYSKFFPEYISIEFVKESILPFYRKQIQKEPINIIEEIALPDDIGIFLKI